MEEAFEIAAEEPKIATREQVLSRNSRPLSQVDSVPVPPSYTHLSTPSVEKSSEAYSSNSDEGPGASQGAREVMRKHMTQALDEALQAYPQLVYIGEDVVHGGYYLVTGA